MKEHMIRVAKRLPQCRENTENMVYNKVAVKINVGRQLCYRFDMLDSTIRDNELYNSLEVVLSKYKF